MKDFSDTQLIQLQLRSNDDAYFVELLDRYAQIVFGRCLSMLKNSEDADDAAQVIWMKVYFALPNFEDKSAFKTWLFRIVNNHCLNIIRARRDIFAELDENDEHITKAYTSLEENVGNKIDVTNLLKTVSKEEKAVLILKYVDGYSYEEIAGQLNISVSAAKMRVTRAKERIRAYAK